MLEEKPDGLELLKSLNDTAAQEKRGEKFVPAVPIPDTEAARIEASQRAVQARASNGSVRGFVNRTLADLGLGKPKA